MRANDFANPYLVHLQTEAGGDIDEELPITTKCVIFGRKTELCNVVVRDASISRQHAALMHAESGGRAETYVQDLGSASGSFVDGQRIASDKPHRLADGSAMSFGEGRATYTFRVGAPAAASQEGTAGRQKKRPKRG